ncbi:MAG TPA: hypothetical protein VF535_13855 [Allosphingosinicella sp.]|jgi:hypothetical protein
MAAIISGLVGAFAATILVLIGMPNGSAEIDANGWKVLRPGWLLKGAILLCAGLAAFIASATYFAGSAREDAAGQLLCGVLLAAGFGCAGLYAAWRTFGRIIAWKGDEIRVTPLFGPGFRNPMTEVAYVRGSETSGEYRLNFRDGSTLRISAYFHGAAELLETLRNPALSPEQAR